MIAETKNVTSHGSSPAKDVAACLWEQLQASSPGVFSPVSIYRSSSSKLCLVKFEV